MYRELPESITSELTSEVVYPFFAVDLDFESQPVYIWTGYGDLVYEGKTYLGAGQLIGVSSVEETSEIEAKGITLTMSGIPSSFLALALNEPYQGRECRLYFGMFYNKTLVEQDGDEITNQATLPIAVEKGSANLVEIFSGELDQMNISENADTCTIAVTAENVLIKLERPVIRRFTNADQKSRFPQDKGLQYVASLQNKEIFWGRTK